jgi:hypothetical protein
MTEDKNRMFIHNTLQDYGITGYTIEETDSRYGGCRERGLCITILDDDLKYSVDLLDRVCRTIKVLNRQNSVYLEIKNVELKKV